MEMKFEMADGKEISARIVERIKKCKQYPYERIKLEDKDGNWYYLSPPPEKKILQ